MKSYVKKSVLIFVSIVLSGCGLTAPKSNDGYVDLNALGALERRLHNDAVLRSDTTSVCFQAYR